MLLFRTSRTVSSGRTSNKVGSSDDVSGPDGCVVLLASGGGSLHWHGGCSDENLASRSTGPESISIWTNNCVSNVLEGECSVLEG